MNFLGNHGFRFHHLVDTAADGEFGDVPAGFGRIRGPEDVTTAFFHTLFEFEKIAIEIVERFPFDFVAALPCASQSAKRERPRSLALLY